jgi:hypothetical protein
MNRSLITVLAIITALMSHTGVAQAAGLEGTWQANGTGTAGNCGSWAVRLTIAQSKSSGYVTVERGSQALEDIALQADGTFSASTPGGWTSASNSGGMAPYSVAGKLSADTISVSITTTRCGTQTGQGTRTKI